MIFFYKVVISRVVPITCWWWWLSDDWWLRNCSPFRLLPLLAFFTLMGSEDERNSSRYFSLDIVTYRPTEYQGIKPTVHIAQYSVCIWMRFFPLNCTVHSTLNYHILSLVVLGRHTVRNWNKVCHNSVVIHCKCSLHWGFYELAIGWEDLFLLHRSKFVSPIEIEPIHIHSRELLQEVPAIFCWCKVSTAWPASCNQLKHLHVLNKDMFNLPVLGFLM